MDIYNSNISDSDSLLEKFTKNDEVIIEIIELNQKDKIFLSEFLKQCLEEIGKESIYDYLHYCLNEILENAKKANLKRIFFKSNKLEITNPADYFKGMKDFNTKCFKNEEHFSKLLKNNNYYIRASFKVEDDIFILSVKNNSLISTEELQIARERIASAKKFNSIEEAFATLSTSKEGAGLGIIISILMLKKIGLSKDSLNIYKSKNETITSIMIPLSLITIEQNKIINEIVIKEINSIPKFPEHILKLQELLNTPDVELKEITDIISDDPSLTADILRMANSAIFMLQNRISSINEAVKLVGFKKLKELLYSYGTIEILKKRYDFDKMKRILNHSHKVAFFAVRLGKIFLPNESPEDLYISAILHDIGHILLIGINPNFIKDLTKICQTKSIPIRIIEDITTGYNHALIGATMAQKWNFPEKYIQSIQYHNKPLDSDPKYSSIIYCIYLANLMSHEEDQYELYKQIYTPILHFFKIHSFSEYNNLYNSINDEFKKTKKSK